jgi:hypothetical protein
LYTDLIRSTRGAANEIIVSCNSSPHRNMSAEVKRQIQLEIAHVLFIDIVGYSKLSINEQKAAVDELTQIDVSQGLIFLRHRNG